MTLDDHFEISESDRIDFIEEYIVAHILPETKDQIRERAKIITNLYQGKDIAALSILSYAAEKGRFDEFAEKLEAQCKENLGFIHPQHRKHSPPSPAIFRAEMFFLGCYKELDVAPSSDSARL